MPENEKPPAMPVDIYSYIQFRFSALFIALSVALTHEPYRFLAYCSHMRSFVPANEVVIEQELLIFHAKRTYHIVVHNSLDECGLIPRYTVQFVDHDGSVIYETQVLSGESVEYPEIPFQRQTPQYILEFTGWSDVPENITRNMTIRAQYEFIQRKYTVTFYDMDGNVLAQRERAYGDTIDPPALSEIESPYMSEEYYFSGWYLDEKLSESMSNLDTIKGEMTIYGKWTKKPQEAPSEEKPDVQPNDTKKPNYTWLYILLTVASFVIIAVGTIIIHFKKKRK